jgi:hypothetical protein
MGRRVIALKGLFPLSKNQPVGMGFEGPRLWAAASGRSGYHISLTGQNMATSGHGLRRTPLLPSSLELDGNA